MLRPARDFCVFLCDMRRRDVPRRVPTPSNRKLQFKIMFHHKFISKKMTEIKNAVLGTAKKPYEKPEIEVFDLDNQAPLLAASPTYTPQWGDYDSENI